jgi:hypothetical protein
VPSEEEAVAILADERQRIPVRRKPFSPSATETLQRALERLATRKPMIADRSCRCASRATGITAYLENDGTSGHVQQVAIYESPRTTKLYDRTGDQITLDEVERIII